MAVQGHCEATPTITFDSLNVNHRGGNDLELLIDFSPTLGPLFGSLFIANEFDNDSINVEVTRRFTSI